MVGDILKDLVKGVLAGIMIGIGGCVNLSLDNKVLGALFFSIGLFVIVTRQFNLFTGKIGYIVNNNLSYLKEVIFTLIGNFIGTVLFAIILRYTRISNLMVSKATELCNIKLSDSLISIFILSVLCGILMFIAVDGYKNMKDEMGKYLSVFLCVIVFILSGFEHSIANMYYFAMAKASIWGFKVVLYLFIMMLGNACGGILIPLCGKISNGKNINVK